MRFGHCKPLPHAFPNGAKSAKRPLPCASPPPFPPRCAESCRSPGRWR